MATATAMPLPHAPFATEASSLRSFHANALASSSSSLRSASSKAKRVLALPSLLGSGRRATSGLAKSALEAEKSDTVRRKHPLSAINNNETTQDTRSKPRTVLRFITTKLSKSPTTPAPQSSPSLPPPPPLPSTAQAAKEKRDAALRECGLLPPLRPNRDLSAQERAQDARLPIVPKSPDDDDADAKAKISAADLIKKQWEEKNKSASSLPPESPVSHKEVTRLRLKEFKFGGQSPPTSPVDTISPSSPTMSPNPPLLSPKDASHSTPPTPVKTKTRPAALHLISEPRSSIAGSDVDALQVPLPLSPPPESLRSIGSPRLGSALGSPRPGSTPGSPRLPGSPRIPGSPRLPSSPGSPPTHPLPPTPIPNASDALPSMVHRRKPSADAESNTSIKPPPSPSLAPPPTPTISLTPPISPVIQEPTNTQRDDATECSASLRSYPPSSVFSHSPSMVTTSTTFTSPPSSYHHHRVNSIPNRTSLAFSESGESSCSVIESATLPQSNVTDSTNPFGRYPSSKQDEPSNIPDLGVIAEEEGASLTSSPKQSPRLPPGAGAGVTPSSPGASLALNNTTPHRDTFTPRARGMTESAVSTKPVVQTTIPVRAKTRGEAQFHRGTLAPPAPKRKRSILQVAFGTFRRGTGEQSVGTVAATPDAMPRPSVSSIGSGFASSERAQSTSPLQVEIPPRPASPRLGHKIRRLSVSASLTNMRLSVSSSLSRTSMKRERESQRPKSTLEIGSKGDGGLKMFDASHLPPSPSSAEFLGRAGSVLNPEFNGKAKSTGQAPPRRSIQPTLHSRGSILLETTNIEDEESRRITEMAFLG